jgi:hypothetical protein
VSSLPSNSCGRPRRLGWWSLGAALVITAGIALPAAHATNTDGGGSGQLVQVHHVLVPTIPEVIESGESLQLELSVSAGDAFCDAILNYDTVD